VNTQSSRIAPAAALPRGGWLLATFTLLALAVFAFEGPHRPAGIAALVVAFGMLLVLLPWGTGLWFIPLAGLALPVSQPLPAVHMFDLPSAILIVVALGATLASRRREAWDVRGPGRFAFAMLAVPLVAFPFVVSRPSFLAAYKGYLLLVGLFLALRRLVPRTSARVLLWLYPVTGTLVAFQLLSRTRGLGALLFSRLKFRNFYSGLGWGQSDYISAVLEFCLCGTVLLILFEKRLAMRVALAAAAFVMVQAFLILFSRSGAISLLVFGAFLAFGWKRERALLAMGAGTLAAIAAAATPGGQVLLQRFTDPAEYSSWYFRLLTWETGIERFLQHPWTGYGLNQGRHIPDVIGSDSSNSSIIDFFGEQGILGGVLFVAIVVAAFRMARRAEWHGRPLPRPMRAALLGTVAAVVLHSLVEPTLTGNVMQVMFVYLLAFLTLLDSRGSGESAVPAPASAGSGAAAGRAVPTTSGPTTSGPTISGPTISG